MKEGHYNVPTHTSGSLTLAPGLDVKDKHARHKALRYLKRIGALVAGRDKVQVKIIDSGQYNAFTKDNVIYIRNGDFTNPNYLNLVEGIIDHEAGHLKYSDFEYLKTLRLTPFEMGLFNAIEDVRMERHVKERLPGSITNLRGMCEVLVRYGCAEYHNKPFGILLQGYVMLYCRYHFNGDMCMFQSMKAACDALTTHIDKDFVNTLHDVLAPVQDITAIEAIPPIVSSIIRLLESKQSNEKSDGQTEAKENTEQQAEHSQRSATQDAHFENQNKDAISSPRTQKNSKSASQSVQAAPKTSSTLSEKIEAALSAQSSDSDLHDKARNAMNEIAQQAASKGLVDSFLVERTYITNPQLCTTFFDSTLSRRLASKLTPIVRKAFYSLLPKADSYKTRGIQLAPQRFADAIAGQNVVFKDAPIRRQPVANVHIAVDCSLSMEGTGVPSESPMLVANTAVYGLAKTLYQLPSINVQVDYFTSYKKVLFYRACSFSQSPVQHKFSVKPFGSTPTGEAIREGVEQLLKKQRGGENNYLVMILDGDLPDDDGGAGICHIDGMLTLARQLEITVFCIILSPLKQETFHSAGLKKHECIFIKDAHQLPNAFETLVQQSLFTR